MSKQLDLNNLFGMNNEAAAFLVILKDFADQFEARLQNHPEYIHALITDIEQRPDDWYKAWFDELGMGAHVVIFGTAAKLLLIEYTAARVTTTSRTLEDADTQQARQRTEGGE